MTGKHGTLLERFERHYIPEPMSGCWIWIGSLNKNGYAQMSAPHADESPLRAHVVSYKLFKGKIKKGLDVRHTCDLRCCVNPDHLLVGTRKQNMDDCEQRGRIARGFKLPHTKLSPEQIRRIVTDKRLHKKIARDYSISTSYVSMLKNGTRRHRSR